MGTIADENLPVNIEYLTDIIILLSAAVIAVPLFQFLGLGAIPGFLVAGIVLGPSGLGYFALVLFALAMGMGLFDELLFQQLLNLLSC